MKRTPQIEEYCASLTLSREHPTDSLLQTFIGAQSAVKDRGGKAVAE